MIELTLAEVAELTGGRLRNADAAAVVTGTVEFDSRKVTGGGLFVALPGEHVDGHDYTKHATEAGAVASIVAREVDEPAIVVDDPLKALADLARGVLARLKDITVVGVTGSSGKTSTKDLLAQLLSRLGETVAPPESFNNEIGHPYTVLRATTSTRYLVLEKSARKIGHIAELTRIAPPRIGVELNVGVAHVGEFGSRDAIATAKAELVQALPPADQGGVAVLNADDPRVRAMAEKTTAKVVLTGRAEDADVRAEKVQLDEIGRPGFDIHVGGQMAPVQMALYGEHHVGNALAAAAVALELGMPLAAAAAGLSEATVVSRRRMEVSTRPDGVTVIDDTFNANPDSVRVALRNQAAIAGDRRRWLVLGEMAELGDTAEAEHQQIGRYAVELGVTRIVATGPHASAVVAGAENVASGDTEVVEVADTGEAVALLSARLEPGDVVLVKGSKVAHMEHVTAALLAPPSGPSAGGAEASA
ncbi:UDP-N-acetylmuramoyl-tripeptide--D-alanyl-D-alanine ligase [Fodinicola acaciae]|uniref:UDP-N-acetylmuramoyl-tripeptide--D-alanyl-D- alanine ligase n=1 Tax=Fodinicola acaciae TaxID=2681555 RepID=UPI0013D1E5ED|nr:UDP-N-acetylmuramoyl-tripeptide--D-alanyl-D-alanine ligase [Fodinicola acaciae]